MKKVFLTLTLAIIMIAAFAQNLRPSTNFHLEYRQVQRGENVIGIALSQGSNLATLIYDNPWLSSRLTKNAAGNFDYRLYPGDMLLVRAMGNYSVPVIAEPQNTYVTHNKDFTNTPVFWIIISFVILLVIVVSILVGINWNRRAPQQVLVQQVPQQFMPLQQAPAGQYQQQQIVINPRNNQPEIIFVVMEVPTPPAPASAEATKK